MVIYLGHGGFPGIVKNTYFWVKSLRGGAREELLQDYDAIIISDIRYGRFMRLLYFTPDSMDIYADSSARLLQNPQRWSHPISKSTLYVQYYYYGLVDKKPDAILDTLRLDNNVTLLDDNLLGNYRVYLIDGKIKT